MEIIENNLKYKDLIKFIKNKLDINNIKNNIISSVILKIENKYIITGIATGNKNIKTINKFQLADMHAEILSIKLFKYFWKNNVNKYFDNIDNKYYLKKNIKILFYTSKVPCGDCSIIKDKDNNILEIGKSTPFNKIHNFENKFIKRLKPFRKDLPLEKISKSLSCTDKLLKYSLLGIQIDKNILPVKIDNFIIEYDLGNLNNKQIIIDNINNSLNIKNRLNKINNNIFLKIIKYPIKIKIPKIKIIFNKNNYKNISNCNSILIYYNNKKETINGKIGLLQGASLKNSNINTCSNLKKVEYNKDKKYDLNKLIFKYLIN